MNVLVTGRAGFIGSHTIISGAVHYFRNMPDTWGIFLEKCALSVVIVWKRIAPGICTKSIPMSLTLQAILTLQNL